MVEYRRTGYTRLVDVRVLHHYWLDVGTEVFGAGQTSPAEQERLLAYDVTRLLSIRATPATSRLVAGLRGVVRTTGTGVVVAVPDDATVPTEAVLEFTVTVTAPELPLVTALTLHPQQTVDVVDPVDERRVHRYRSEVPVLSNLTGTRRGTGPASRLYLSREYPDAADGDGVEALVVSGADLCRLVADPPDAPLQVLGARDTLPVYVHRGDVPAITPPAGSTGAPERGIELAPDTPPDIVALVRLAAQRPDDPAFSMVDDDGRPLPPRVFEIHLPNRWTTWRYRDRRDGTVSSTEPAPLPLTHVGNAGTKTKPPPSGFGVVRDPAAPDRITQLVSDVYT